MTTPFMRTRPFPSLLLVHTPADNETKRHNAAHPHYSLAGMSADDRASMLGLAVAHREPFWKVHSVSTSVSFERQSQSALQPTSSSTPPPSLPFLPHSTAEKNRVRRIRKA